MNWLDCRHASGELARPRACQRAAILHVESMVWPPKLSSNHGVRLCWGDRSECSYREHEHCASNVPEVGI